MLHSALVIEADAVCFLPANDHMIGVSLMRPNQNQNIGFCVGVIVFS